MAGAAARVAASDVESVYEPDPDWPRLPPGQALGPVTSVACAPSGEVYVLHRGTPPVLVFDAAGTFLRGWGTDEIPDGGGHFLRLDPAGRPWITDTRRHQVLTFDPDGALVATLGRRGEPGDGPDSFDQPTDLAFLPSGEFFVSDGYGNARILRYGADRRLVLAWGRRGREPGEFDTPHALALDSTGRLYISDRGNSRIQVYDSDGRFAAEWRVLPYIDGLAIAPDDSLFAVTGRANGILRLSTFAVEPGGEDVRPVVLEAAGSRYSGYRELMTHAVPPPGQFNMIHGVAVDATGDVYVAEVRARRVQKLVRRAPFRPQADAVGAAAAATAPGGR